MVSRVPIHFRVSDRAAGLLPRPGADMLALARAHGATVILPAILFMAFIGLNPIAVVGIDESSVGTQTGDGDTMRQIVFLLLYSLIIGHTIATRGARALLDIPIGFVAVLGWCWLSLTWAIEPGIAFRRLFLTTIIVQSVCYCVRSLGYQAVVRVLVWTFVAILILDWLAVAVFHDALQQATEVEKELAGDWRGMHEHKNGAGGFCALSAILFLHISWRDRLRLVGPMLVPASLIFLYMSQSKTSGGFVLAAVVVGSLANLGYRNPGLRNVASALLTVLVILYFIFVPFDLDAALSVLDDPGSFTGRSQIWELMFRYISDHLLFGAGYGSFWSIGDSSPVLQYHVAWLKQINQSHNGYLAVLSETGIIGLLFTLYFLAVRPFYLLFSAPLGDGVSRWLICAVLSFCLLRNLLESCLLNRADPVWIVMVIMYCLLFQSRKAAVVV